MTEMRQDHLAFDLKSARRIDADGHMHVEGCNISIAAINEYAGQEIPGWQAQGLEPDKLYRLLRDPAELAESASSFNGKPLLTVHKSQAAETHDHLLTVGSVNNVRWAPPYLVGDLSIWDADAIRRIQDGSQRQLSSSYRYQYDPTPGTHEGKPYDGRMVNIVANHVALVSQGRAGPTVTVGDELPLNLRSYSMITKKQALQARADAYLKAAATFANDEAMKPHHAHLRARAEALKVKAEKTNPALALAADADPETEAEDEEDDETEAERKARLAREAAADKKAKDKAAKDKKAKDKKARDEEREEGETDEEFEDRMKKKDDDDKAEDKKAMDAAISAGIAAEASAIRKHFRELDQARQDVFPVVGPIVSAAMDSAEKVYEFALKQKGIDLKGLEKTTANLRWALLNSAQPTAAPKTVAMDAAAEASLEADFPMIARIK